MVYLKDKIAVGYVDLSNKETTVSGLGNIAIRIPNPEALQTGETTGSYSINIGTQAPYNSFPEGDPLAGTHQAYKTKKKEKRN